MITIILILIKKFKTGVSKTDSLIITHDNKACITMFYQFRKDDFTILCQEQPGGVIVTLSRDKHVGQNVCLAMVTPGNLFYLSENKWVLIDSKSMVTEKYTDHLKLVSGAISIATTRLPIGNSYLKLDSIELRLIEAVCYDMTLRDLRWLPPAAMYYLGSGKLVTVIAQQPTGEYKIPNDGDVRNLTQISTASYYINNTQIAKPNTPTVCISPSTPTGNVQVQTTLIHKAATPTPNPPSVKPRNVTRKEKEEDFTLPPLGPLPPDPNYNAKTIIKLGEPRRTPTHVLRAKHRDFYEMAAARGQWKKDHPNWMEEMYPNADKNEEECRIKQAEIDKIRIEEEQKKKLEEEIEYKRILEKYEREKLELIRIREEEKERIRMEKIRKDQILTETLYQTFVPKDKEDESDDDNNSDNDDDNEPEVEPEIVSTADFDEMLGIKPRRKDSFLNTIHDTIDNVPEEEVMNQMIEVEQSVDQTVTNQMIEVDQTVGSNDQTQIVENIDSADTMVMESISVLISQDDTVLISQDDTVLISQDDTDEADTQLLYDHEIQIKTNKYKLKTFTPTPHDEDLLDIVINADNAK